MLSWVVTFLVVALIAGILGFGGIAGVSIEIAKAIFFHRGRAFYHLGGGWSGTGTYPRLIVSSAPASRSFCRCPRGAGWPNGRPPGP